MRTYLWAKSDIFFIVSWIYLQKMHPLRLEGLIQWSCSPSHNIFLLSRALFWMALFFFFPFFKHPLIYLKSNQMSTHNINWTAEALMDFIPVNNIFPFYFTHLSNSSSLKYKYWELEFHGNTLLCFCVSIQQKTACNHVDGSLTFFFSPQI